MKIWFAFEKVKDYENIDNENIDDENKKEYIKVVHICYNSSVAIYLNVISSCDYKGNEYSFYCDVGDLLVKYSKEYNLKFEIYNGDDGCLDYGVCGGNEQIIKEVLKLMSKGMGKITQPKNPYPESDDDL